MKRDLIDLTGQRFHLWTVLSRDGVDSNAGHPRWKCRCDCGVERVVVGDNIRYGSSTGCGCVRLEKSKRRVGSRHHNFKTGKSKDKHGYVILNNPDPLPGQPRKAKKEHTWVMEQILGRPLFPGETVHHKNGVRDDNRPENLELWASSHRWGQRVSDLISHAEELLQRYAPEKLRRF